MLRPTTRASAQRGRVCGSLKTHATSWSPPRWDALPDNGAKGWAFWVDWSQIQAWRTWRGETILSLSSLELCLRLLLSHRLACSLLSDVIIILIGPNENYTCRGKGITCVPHLNLVLPKLQVTGKKDMCLSVYTYLLCITVALIMTFSPWMRLTRDFLAALGIWGWKKKLQGILGIIFPFLNRC